MHIITNNIQIPTEEFNELSYINTARTIKTMRVDCEQNTYM